MAEVAGIALGVLALASTFKDCIELFSYITAAKSLGKDYELLITSLDVEKTLLLQWAQRTRLMEDDYDLRLSVHSTNIAVLKVLASIQLLLSESKVLREKYGLQEQSKGELDAEDALVAGLVMSGNRMKAITKAFSELKIRTERHRVETPVIHQVKWVIYDKTKFVVLVGRLGSFVSKLNELVPASSDFIIRDMVRTDLGHLSNTAQLKLVHDAAFGRDTVVASAARDSLVLRCEEKILSSLWFRRMTEREENIKQALPSTLDWAFNTSQEDSECDKKCDSLRRWLREGCGIYWLCGKAGSGKSTAMKHISRHEITAQWLQAWASERTLIIANCFFWYAGSPMQKSLEGLCRTLQHTILNSNRSLIPTLLPGLWEEAYGQDIKKFDPPTRSELRQAFDSLPSGQDTEHKFCFFIDGFDEYAGDYDEAIDLLLQLSKDANIKILISSRPTPACWNAFSRMPQLQLQELTLGDIRLYIHSKIGQHPHMRELEEENEGVTSELIAELTGKASGVFLWVVLACRSVLEGLANCDRYHELRRRVDELPPEIGDLFRHMLNKIDQRYRTQAAHLLRVVLHSTLNQHTRPLKTLGLAMVEHHGMDPSISTSLQSFHRRRLHARCTMLEGRLRSRCCGLLELLDSTFESRERDEQRYHCFCGNHPYGDVHTVLMDSTVVFMHRTVFEYLKVPGVLDLDCLKPEAGFDPNAVLSRASMLLATRLLTDRPAATPEYVTDMLLYAAAADSDSVGTVIAIMKHFTEVLSQYDSDQALQIRLSCFMDLDLPNLCGLWPLILLLSIEGGLVNVLQHLETLHGRTICRTSLFSSPLMHVIRRPLFDSCMSWRPSVSADMVSYLLSAGWDPNQDLVDSSQPQPCTPWSVWLACMEEFDPGEPGHEIEITKAFVDSGADLTVGDYAISRVCISRLSRPAADEQRELGWNDLLALPGICDLAATQEIRKSMKVPARSSASPYSQLASSATRNDIWGPKPLRDGAVSDEATLGTIRTVTSRKRRRETNRDIEPGIKRIPHQRRRRVLST